MNKVLRWQQVLFPVYTGQRVATYGDMLDEEGNPIQVGTNEDGTPIFAQNRLN